MTYAERVDAFMCKLALPRTYRVGGSVRDELLGRRVKDCDYVVFQASLEEIKHELKKGKLYEPTLKITPLKLRDGRQAGWRAAIEGLGLIEIVLPRVERSTGPGHRDFEIILSPGISLKQDAQRRDFTFNAIYRDVRTGRIEDPLSGAADLLRRTVQVTHATSFRDDPLRILRALRFVSTLGYELDPTTRDLMSAYAPSIQYLTLKGTSGTVLTEFKAILMGEHAVEALDLAYETGVTAEFLPEVLPGWEDGRARKLFEAAVHVDAPLNVRLACLLAEPEGSGAWRRMAKRLNAPNRLLTDVGSIIHNLDSPAIDRTGVYHGRVRYGDDLYKSILEAQACALIAAGKHGNGDNMDLVLVLHHERTRAFAQRCGVPCKVTDLEINGHDVMQLGAEGKQIGEVLREVLFDVLTSPGLTRCSREWQLARAEALLAP